jgi:hypothetical protein
MGGVKFTDSTAAELAKLKPRNFWFKIPKWLAGRWEYYDAKRTSFTDLKTGKTDDTPVESHNEATTVWGWQQDKSGNIWEFEDSPHTSMSYSPHATTYYVRQKHSPLKIANNKFTCKMSFTYFAVDKESNTLTNTFQSVDTVTYNKLSDTRIRRDVIAQVFDEHGSPISKSAASSFARRLAPFHAIAESEGKDMHSLFEDFLKEHEHSDKHK